MAKHAEKQSGQQKKQIKCRWWRGIWRGRGQTGGVGGWVDEPDGRANGAGDDVVLGGQPGLLALAQVGLNENNCKRT